MGDAVNHPDHYGGESPTEPIRVIRAWGMNFALGNAVKYLARAGKKDPAKKVEDLSKAIFYIEDEIKRGEDAKRARVALISERDLALIDMGLAMADGGYSDVTKAEAVLRRLRHELAGLD